MYDVGLVDVKASGPLQISSELKVSVKLLARLAPEEIAEIRWLLGKQSPSFSDRLRLMYLSWKVPSYMPEIPAHKVLKDAIDKYGVSSTDKLTILVHKCHLSVLKVSVIKTPFGTLPIRYREDVPEDFLAIVLTKELNDILTRIYSPGKRRMPKGLGLRRQ